MPDRTQSMVRMPSHGVKPTVFELVSPFQPAGDQPAAIAALSAGVAAGRKQQVLMGVTGSGKTFTMANVIQKFNWRMRFPSFMILRPHP